MASLFTKIVKGEIPCYKVAEDNDHLAFLDIFPLHEGHTLVIPKQETDHLFDLDAAAYSALMAFARKVGLAVKDAVPSKRIAVVVAGFEVPHAHIHLIPADTMADIDFSNPKLQLAREQFEKTAALIASKYRS